jgi:hypothetical protein
MANDEYLSVEEGGWVRWLRTGRTFGETVRIRFSQDASGRLVAREIRIAEDEEDGDGLRAEMLRVPLGRLERWVNRADVARLVDELMRGSGSEPVKSPRPRTGPRVDPPDRKGRSSYSDGFYRRVAEAVAAGHSARAIADASGVPPTTVNRWIKGARERGFLARSRRAEGSEH